MPTNATASRPRECDDAWSRTTTIPPGRDNGMLALSAGETLLSSHLSTLLAICPLPFIFVYDPDNPRITASAIRSVVHTLSAEKDPSLPNIASAYVNAVACFTPRLLYDTVLNALANWTPSWEDGCQNWPGSSGDASRWNDSFDSFVHGIQAVHADTKRRAAEPRRVNDKGKGKARDVNIPERTCRMVLVVERAERLRENIPELMVPLTRLAEMVSACSYKELRPESCHILAAVLAPNPVLTRLFLCLHRPKWISPPSSRPRCNGKTSARPSAHRLSPTTLTCHSCQSKVSRTRQ